VCGGGDRTRARLGVTRAGLPPPTPEVGTQVGATWYLYRATPVENNYFSFLNDPNQDLSLMCKKDKYCECLMAAHAKTLLLQIVESCLKSYT